jgi:hypothetical protein
VSAAHAHNTATTNCELLQKINLPNSSDLTNSHPQAARAEIMIPEGIQCVIAGVPIFIARTEIPGAVIPFVELLETDRLRQFMVLRRGISNCHGIVKALYQDLEDAGCEHLFAFKRGSSELLKSKHDPNGLHSWIEINGWAIDVANGANRSIIIMQANTYYDLAKMTNVHDIKNSGQKEILAW